MIGLRRSFYKAGLAVLCLGSVSLYAQEAKQVIHSVAESMDRFVKENEVAGVVTLVADSNGIMHQHATGWSDIQQQKPLNEDAIFWIASMTKPVTGVCVMMLVDEGRLSLDAPISEYLAEMADLKLEDGTPAHITVRQLLTHTSGMAELPGSEAYSSKTLAEAASKYARVKVLFPPGTKWQYSQTSINTAARIVEVVSGQLFDQFVEHRLCQPLQMKDTTFYLDQSQMERLAKSYSRSSEGELVEFPIWLLLGKSPSDRDRFPAANGGLFSTIHDYARFCRMLLGNGELDGVRILRQESVAMFCSPAIEPSIQTGFTPGNTWGIGCCVVREPQGVTAALSPGSFGHGGAFGTQAWIDPVKDRCYLLMVQRTNFPNADASQLRGEFQDLANTALPAGSSR